MEKKNLDRLFQEQFRDFEVAPPDHVWPAIEAELNRKKKRRVIPLWYKLSGVAALLVIGLGLYTVLNSGSTNSTNTVVSAPSETIESVDANREKLQSPTEIIDETPAVVQSEGTDSKMTQSNDNLDDTTPAATNQGSVTSAVASATEEDGDKKPTVNKSRKWNNSRSSGIVSTDLDQKKSPNANAQNKKSEEKASAATGLATVTKSPSEQRETNVGGENALEKAVVQTVKVEPKVSGDGIGKTDSTNRQNENKADAPLTINPASERNAVVQAPKAETQPDSTAIATVEPNTLEELLNEKENNVTASEQKINRWQITSSVAPIYFSSVSNGSPIDSRLSSTNKTYKPSVSYGAGVSYAVNKRLSVRAGVNSLAFEYSTNDLVFYQTQNARQLENVKTNAPGSLIEIDRNPGMLPEMTIQGKAVGKRFDGVLNQRTGYLEVPMEMTYRLVDRKFGVNLIGGMSTLFLNENTVSLASPGMDMVIGEADNLNQVHFSTNVGLGFNYKFLKSFEARFDPMFKYQINTYSNNAGNFKPYFFGLYTGISYRF